MVYESPRDRIYREFCHEHNRTPTTEEREEMEKFIKECDKMCLGPKGYRCEHLFQRNKYTNYMCRFKNVAMSKPYYDKSKIKQKNILDFF